MMRDTVREPTRDRVYEMAYQEVYSVVVHHGTSITLTALRMLDQAAKDGLREEDTHAQEDESPNR